MTEPLRVPGKAVTLRAVQPNAGIQAAYRKRLDALIAAMNKSLLYWLSIDYKNSGAAMALDASPAMQMRDAMAKMAAQWQTNFDEGADKLAKWFANKNKDYTDRALATILKDAGFTVQFKMTAAANDAYQAIIGENIGLIKSIASQELTQVQTLVMQSVQRGRDLGTLTEELQKQFGVTRRRAALIARDQNNKATATITQVRQEQLGITTAKWKHSFGGKEPRPEHVKANGQTYDIKKGMYLDGRWTWPGVEINCRCVSQPIIPGFDD